MSKSQGELAELMFTVEAYRRGLVISQPAGDNAKYDCIIDDRGHLTRTQVKSVSVAQARKTAEAATCYRPILAYGADTKGKYTREHIDVFAIHIIPKDLWYFIPVEVVTAIHATLYPESKPDRRHNPDAGKYEIYREDWTQFAPPS